MIFWQSWILEFSKLFIIFVLDFALRTFLIFKIFCFNVGSISELRLWRLVLLGLPLMVLHIVVGIYFYRPAVPPELKRFLVLALLWLWCSLLLEDLICFYKELSSLVQDVLNGFHSQFWEYYCLNTYGVVFVCITVIFR